MKKILLIPSLLILFFCLSSQSAHAISPRKVNDFCKGWRFNLGDVANGEQSTFDDATWRVLDVPHDWSIEGSFDAKNPATVNGGALPGGIGWYRKSFYVPESDNNKVISIEFDGVYMNSEVWINGHLLGKRPYGYSSFRYELTAYLNYGAKKNVIAVKVDNSQQPNSRWYSGSGIYRNVRLVVTNMIAVDHWGTQVLTSDVTAQSAKIKVSTKVRNWSNTDQQIVLTTFIYNKLGKPVAKSTTVAVVAKNAVNELVQEVKVGNPELWSDLNPVLYNVVSEVDLNGKLIDNYETPFGIRSFQFDRLRGFLLNGRSVKIKGVCNHHDLGCLGSAINYRALQRQLALLKEMGCNAIRTSHNPPAPELLELADKMGFIIMDEAFDMWKMPKNKFDYHLYWDEWHERDLTDMILRDRNHPSVFIWSIGNEIPEQGDTTGTAIARELVDIVHNLDQSRPITAACDHPTPKNFIIKSGALDLVGYNYHQYMYEKFLKDFPNQKFIGTETTSALATRGSYDFPADSIRRWPKDNVVMNSDLSCSSFDNCSAPWGSTHEETWKLMKKHDYLSGMFIWTGFDYLGEPTPYGWPARSSYFGIMDLCGFPKDAFYLYQSEWTDKPVLHVFPHWNWALGKMVDVWAYSNAEEVELFLNGKSLGIKKKVGDELHYAWKVAYEPGILKAVSRTKGVDVLVEEVKTAGAPKQIILSADRDRIKSDGKDLSYVTIKVVDENGVIVPEAENLINFEVKGEGSLVGVDNGSPISMESFNANHRKVFHGLALAVLRSVEKSGTIILHATGEGLAGATLEIQTK